jgi:hypothetical protein
VFFYIFERAAVSVRIKVGITSQQALAVRVSARAGELLFLPELFVTRSEVRGFLVEICAHTSRKHNSSSSTMSEKASQKFNGIGMIQQLNYAMSYGTRFNKLLKTE